MLIGLVLVVVVNKNKGAAAFPEYCGNMTTADKLCHCNYGEEKVVIKENDQIIGYGCKPIMEV